MRALRALSETWGDGRLGRRVQWLVGKTNRLRPRYPTRAVLSSAAAAMSGNRAARVGAEGRGRAMKACVTGATGFLGAHVARVLAERGHDVRVTYRDPDRLKALKGVEFRQA